MVDDEEQTKQLANVLMKTGLTKSYNEAYQKAKDLIKRSADAVKKIDIENLPKKGDLPLMPLTPEEKELIRDRKIIEKVEQEKLRTPELGPQHEIENINPPVDSEKKILPKKAKKELGEIENLETAFIEDKLMQLEMDLEKIKDDSKSETKKIIIEKINDLRQNINQISKEEADEIINEIKNLIEGLRREMEND